MNVPNYDEVVEFTLSDGYARFTEKNDMLQPYS